VIGKLPPPTLAIALLKLRLCVVTRAAAAQLAAAQSACTAAAAAAVAVAAMHWIIKSTIDSLVSSDSCALSIELGYSGVAYAN